MRRLLFVLLLAIAAPVEAQPPDPPAVEVVNQPRPKEPEKQIAYDVAKFVGALREGSFLSASLYVVDARIGFFGANEWIRDWRADVDTRNLQLIDFKLNKIEGDDVEATVSYTFEIGGAPYQETLKLKRRGKAAEPRLTATNGLWGIVIGDRDEVLKKDRYSLERAAVFIQQKPGIIEIVHNQGPHLPDNNESMQQLKQLGLGAMQFVQDYDEAYALDAQYAQEAFLPYIRNERLFIIPGTEEKYAFNAKLSDKTLAQVLLPADTVLFYEGQNEQLNFRYEGKAAVCFADGHVKLIDEEQSKTLRWEP